MRQWIREHFVAVLVGVLGTIAVYGVRARQVGSHVLIETKYASVMARRTLVGVDPLSIRIIAFKGQVVGALPSEVKVTTIVRDGAERLTKAGQGLAKEIDEEQKKAAAKKLEK